MTTVVFWVLFIVWTIIAMVFGAFIYTKFIMWFVLKKCGIKKASDFAIKYYGDKED